MATPGNTMTWEDHAELEADADDVTAALMGLNEKAPPKILQRGRLVAAALLVSSALIFAVTCGFTAGTAKGEGRLVSEGWQPQSLSESGTCSSPQEGMNNNGKNIKKVENYDPEACCQSCLQTSGCVGYTFVREWNECWLKSSVDSPVPGGNVVSGTVGSPMVASAAEGSSQDSSSEPAEQSQAVSAEAPAGTLPISLAECTKAGGCTSKQASVTVDQNWRWYYHPDTSTSCKPCGATNCTGCVLQEDIDYAEYGVTVSEGGKSLTFEKGIRMYVVDGNGKEYYMASLVGKEMSYDVDMSKLPCGTNSALYFVEMPKDGGYEGGAPLGTGYCDAQCPKDGSTVEGKPAVGERPMCCNEFDVWEANRAAWAVTTHVCKKGGEDLEGAYECSGKECKSRTLDGVCDGFGCDFNPFRDGVKNYYAPGSKSGVDTSKPFTVTTQLVADDDGVLIEVRRFYTQGGKKIELPTVEINGSKFSSLTDEYCKAELTDFKKSTAGRGDVCNSEPVGPSIYTDKGGLEVAGRSFDRGNVLVLSLWNDPECHMIWLDGDHGDGHGGSRGPCKHKDHSDGLDTDAVAVTFSNLKFGEIGSTA